jgi:hypothetical protein
VAFSSGLRAGELAALTPAHMDVPRGGLRLEASWTKNRRDGFQPLPRGILELLAETARGKASNDHLLDVPTHPAREFQKDLEKAGIPKYIQGLGKLDFHAARVVYTTLIIEAGATVKEAQTLLRHSTPEMTMNIYARTRDSRLAEVAENVGRTILGQNLTPTSPQWAQSTHPAKVISAYTTNELRQQNVVEAGGIEPPSRDNSSQASTSVVSHLNLASRAPVTGSLDASPCVVSPPPPQAKFGGQPAHVDSPSYHAGEAGEKAT